MLTKKQIDKMFISEIMPGICKQEQEYKQKKDLKDRSLRTQAYNLFVDTLAKDRLITEDQASRYCIPARLIL